MSKWKVILVAFSVLFSFTVFILSQNESKYNAQEVARCANLKSDSDEIDGCIAKELIKLPLSRLTQEMAILERDKVFKGKCHVVSHFVGRLLAKEYTVSETIKGNVNYKLCSQGIMHGYLEEIGNSGTTANLVNVAAELCSKDEPSGCIHGVGHAFSFAKISLDKTAMVCAQVTPKLRLTEEGKKLKPFNYNINCLAGYVMQEALDNQERFLDITPEEFSKICQLNNIDVTYGCLFAHYRQYAKMPNSKTEGKINYFKAQPEDEERVEKLDLFDKYCASLVNDAKSECYKYFGMAIADVYNVERKADYASPILHKLCKENILCFNAYFDIIFSQLLEGAPAYFENFCNSELCTQALKISASNDLFVNPIN